MFTCTEPTTLCHDNTLLILAKYLGTVYSMEWSLGAEFWSGVLEWIGVKFWSGKNDWSCLNQQQNNTGALTWSHSLAVFICPAIFWWLEQKTFAAPKFDSTPKYSLVSKVITLPEVSKVFSLFLYSITRIVKWNLRNSYQRISTYQCQKQYCTYLS